MRKLPVMLLTLVSMLLLTGCGDKLNQFKEAVSGIDHAANKAAQAISLDTHSIRAMEIEHNEKTFTVNDLFKTILRDVQWEYEENNQIHIFTVKGTWQHSLFESYQFTDEQKSELRENGKVTVELELINGQIEPKSTKVILTLNNTILVEETGENALMYLYDYYLSHHL